MYLQWAYIILSSIIFVQLKLSKAKRHDFEIDDLPIDTRSRYHSYHRLNSPQRYYYNLYNKPFFNLLKYLNNKKFLGNVRPFIDLTRDDDFVEIPNYGNLNKFSQDYIDISELSRNGKTPTENNQITYKFKPEQNKKLLTDIHGNTYELIKLLGILARRMLPYHQRSNAFESGTDISSSSESDETTEHYKSNLKSKVRTKYIPKRFQVINNNSGESKSDVDDTINVSIDTSSDIDNIDNKLQVAHNSESNSDEDSTVDETLYIQSPTRHLKTRDFAWRRRLKHFLPKRVHWNEKDFQNLQNYWMSGPRGRYAAQ